jgi:flavin reductase (DIM6/NTAB) family NADH-FMN oxidoreductase RutF
MAVFVLGIKTGSQINGCTISSIISLDVEKNQKILFTLGKNSKFGSLIDHHNSISVNLLNSTQILEAIHFSRVRGEFLAGETFTWNTEGEFFSLKGCETFLTCKLNTKINTDSNTIFVLDVINIVVSDKEKPLVYMNRNFNPAF